MAKQIVSKNIELMASLRQEYPDITFTLYDHTPDCPEGYIMTASDGDNLQQVSYFPGGYSHKEQASKLAQRLLQSKLAQPTNHTSKESE